MKNFLSRLVREGAKNVRVVMSLVLYFCGAWFVPQLMIDLKDLNLRLIKAAAGALGSWSATAELLLRDGGVEKWLLF